MWDVSGRNSADEGMWVFHLLQLCYSSTEEGLLRLDFACYYPSEKSLMSAQPGQVIILGGLCNFLMVPVGSFLLFGFVCPRRSESSDPPPRKWPMC